eukprot:2733590-Amphidinium_carterae.1
MDVLFLHKLAKYSALGGMVLLGALRSCSTIAQDVISLLSIFLQRDSSNCALALGFANLNLVKDDACVRACVRAFFGKYVWRPWDSGDGGRSSVSK